MSREIKFRVVSHGQIIGHEALIDGRWHWNPLPSSKWHKDTTGLFKLRGGSSARDQYTGLKDKKGVEIYEGDIVRLADDWGNENVHQVEYCAEHDYPAFDVKPNVDAEANGLSHFMATGEIEVIGNIYENVDFLEAK